MGRLFIHIGLPKTATSTLQTDVFPKLQDERLKYLGVDGERREGKSSALYYKFIEVVESGYGTDELRLQIENELQHTDLLLSEEGFTVSSRNITWQVKLNRLASIVKGMDYTIIVGVREPVSAMFSYYVELYPRFSKLPFIECALTHNDMFIYHYGKLLHELTRLFDGNRLFFIKFEDIVARKIEPLITLLLGKRVCREICYGVHNSRREENGKVVSRYRWTPYTLVFPLLSSTYMWLGLNKSLTIKRAAHFLKRHLIRLDKYSFRTIKVDKPTDSDIVFLKGKMSEEANALSKRYGIQYAP